MRCFRRMRYVERLKAFVRPKCHPIFFHPLLNGSFTALLNFYQARILFSYEQLQEPSKRSMSKKTC